MKSSLRACVNEILTPMADKIDALLQWEKTVYNCITYVSSGTTKRPASSAEIWTAVLRRHQRDDPPNPHIVSWPVRSLHQPRHHHQVRDIRQVCESRRKTGGCWTKIQLRILFIWSMFTLKWRWQHLSNWKMLQPVGLGNSMIRYAIFRKA
jgi:hypothetical protein